MRKIFFMLIVLLAGHMLLAQKQKGKWGNVIKTVDTVTHTVRKIFPSKKDKQKKQEEKIEEPESPPAWDDANAQISSGGGAGAPGDVHPDAVYIDADYLTPFNNGAAIISKSIKDAMIDVKGKFLVPYGIYSFSGSKILKTLANGLFPATLIANGGRICLTADGKLLEEPGAEFQGLTEDEQYAVFRKSATAFVYVDKNRVRITSKYRFTSITEGIGITTIEGKRKEMSGELTNSHQVFVNVRENRIIPMKNYSQIWPFSGGMAIVAVKDEFYEVRYGFIDSTGKEAIVPAYSNLPSSFKGGLARVVPTNTRDFAYAFIDRKGNIVVKHRPEDFKNWIGGNFRPFTTNGYAFCDGAVMDASGKVISEKDFLHEKGGIAVKSNWVYIVTSEDRSGQIENGFVRYFRKQMQTKDDFNFGGFINLKTGKGVEPSFRYTNQSNWMIFDPVSLLAIAYRFTGRKAGVQTWRKGYINEEGIFMILTKEPGDW